MAAECSESKSSASTVDTYIGSLISLTSKSEIRYEGVLYNINPDESSIGLRNVRSFGTEGRKKEGPQVSPSDRIYDYILFRGSDIKDLQVKASPPVQPQQPAPPLNNDPAIIQSHYPRPLSTSNGIPSAVSGPLTGLSLHNAQVGLHGSNFQGGMPLYQAGVNLGSWGATPPPPNASGSGLAMPLYWQGFYGPANGLPQLPQQALLQPPLGLAVPASLQQPLQYPNFNSHLHTGSSAPQGSNLPAAPCSLLPSTTSSISLSSNSISPNLPSTVPPVPSVSLAFEAISSSLLNTAPSPGPSTLNQNVSSPSLPLLFTSSVESSTVNPPLLGKPNVVSGTSLQHQGTSVSTSSEADALSALCLDKPKPSLVTPGQLMQSVSTAVTQSQHVQTTGKDVEVVPSSSLAVSEQSVPVTSEAQPPILPLPAPARTSHKPNGAPSKYYHGFRGRGRRRDSGRSHTVTKFTEEFDFTAMNEKFNKDEVWGHLGKSGNPNNGDSSQDEANSENPRIEIKPFYNKDDFFDSLSSNSLDRESQNGRPKFSEQLKIDAETFGDFPRYRGGRGGRGRFQGGRSHGLYGRGYGCGRGRGRSVASRAS